MAERFKRKYEKVKDGDLNVLMNELLSLGYELTGDWTIELGKRKVRQIRVMPNSKTAVAVGVVEIKDN